MQNKIPNKKNDGLYMLKGFAMFLVIAVHSTQCFPNLNYGIEQLSRVGRWGCQLFFVISGFLMVKSWSNGSDIKDFYKRRFSSLIPGYYLAILFYVCLSLIWNEKTGMFYPFHISKKSVLINVFLVHGLSPSSFNSVVPGGWFIGTQCIFLILFPLCIFIYEKSKKDQQKNIPYYGFTLSVLIQLGIYFYLEDYNVIKITSFLHYSFINQLPCFLLGISLYYEFKETKFKNKSIKKEIVFAMIWGSIATIIFYLSNEVVVFSAIVAFIFSIAFRHLFIIGVLMKDRDYIGRQFLVDLGKVSYAAYYTNFVICMLLPWIFFRYIDLEIDSTVLYIVGIIPMIYGTYISAVLLNKVLLFFTNKVNRLIEKI